MAKFKNVGYVSKVKNFNKDNPMFTLKIEKSFTAKEGTRLLLSKPKAYTNKAGETKTQPEWKTFEVTVILDDSEEDETKNPFKDLAAKDSDDVPF
jgi:hypothetical protein